MNVFFGGFSIEVSTKREWKVDGVFLIERLQYTMKNRFKHHKEMNGHIIIQSKWGCLSLNKII